MQKNRKLATPPRPVRRFPVPVPDVINMDDIGNMIDEDLLSRLHSLEEDMGHVFDARMDTLLWEIELAYIKREQGLRRRRRDLHERYMRDMARDFADSEVGLPTADLDNSQFTDLDR